MYSRYILLSALLVIGAETYAKNSKTEVVSLSSSYNNSVENNSVDSSSQDSIFKDETLHEVKVVARKSGTSRLAGAVNGIAVNKDELFKAACCNLGESIKAINMLSERFIPIFCTFLFSSCKIKHFHQNMKLIPP
jgi:hypothetical protein